MITPELNVHETLPEKVDRAEKADAGRLEKCRVCDGGLVVSDHRDKVARLLVDITKRLRVLSVRDAMKVKAHVYSKVADFLSSGDVRQQQHRNPDDAR
jgi:hypothetical protein